MTAQRGTNQRDQRSRGSSVLSSLMLRLERAQSLDAGVQAAQPVMDTVTANPFLRGLLQGSWLGHALHPLVVQLPMGAWMSALVVELSGTDREGSATQLLTALGIASAVPAAVTGWAELAETGRREKRVGVVHALANASGIQLQIVALIARHFGNRRLALSCSAAAMAALGAAGYLGGHLAVARGVGTRDPAFAGSTTTIPEPMPRARPRSWVDDWRDQPGLRPARYHRGDLPGVSLHGRRPTGSQARSRTRQSSS